MLFLPGITLEHYVDTTSVTSKGQVTIPKALRQKIGLRTGSKVAFVMVNGRVEMRVVNTPAQVTGNGFGMLKSKHRAIPADFDPAAVLASRRAAQSR
jgi:AbrB family looped-hinge helix DNA binding protein